MKKIILTFSLSAILLSVACTTSKNNTLGGQHNPTQPVATPTVITATENSETKQVSLKPMPSAEHKAMPSKSAKQQLQVESPKPLPVTSKY